MKILIQIIMFLLILMNFSAGVFAGTIGIGIQGGVNEYSAPWGDDAVFKKYETDPKFAAGIILTWSFFDAWNITGTYTENNYGGNMKYTLEEQGTGRSIVYKADELEIKRRDLDLILTRKFFERYSIFIGYKNMYTDVVPGDMTVEYNGTTNAAPAVETDFLHTNTNAYGIGGGVSIPVAGNMFCNVNLSMLYVSTTLSPNEYNKQNYTLTEESENKFSDSEYTGYGLNSSVSMSYYVEPISTAFVLTGRIHYIQYISGDSEKIDMDKEIMSGVYLSAVFYF